MLTAALDLLDEGGASACTIEAAAVRSGVAKTTIYRQFDDREDLLFAVLEAQKPPVDAPDTGDIVADLETMMLELAANLSDVRGARLMASMIDLAEHNERASCMAEEFGTRRRAVLIGRLRRAITDGELIEDVDLEVVSAQLVGPLFYRRFVSRQPLPRRFVTRLVRSTLEPHRASRPCSGAADGESPRSVR